MHSGYVLPQAFSKNPKSVVETPTTKDYDFLSFDAIEMYFIPLDSWRQAQQPCAKRLKICLVEEISPIKVKNYDHCQKLWQISEY